MVQIVGTDRVNMAKQGQLDIGIGWHHDQIVSVVINRLPYRPQPVFLEISGKEVQNLSLFPRGAIDVDQSTQQLSNTLRLDSGR
jgi:hypothetical protein